MQKVIQDETALLPAGMQRPDYDGGSIVNLMSTVAMGRGADSTDYAPLRLLDDVDVSGYQNVLLILIDGLGYDYIQNQGANSVLAQYTRGSLSSVFPTTTAAAITTFLTGLAPAQHAITGWHVWLEEIRTLTAVLPFRSRTGHESLQARGIDAATLLDARSIYARLAVDSHVISPQRIAYSPFNSAFSAGATVHDYDQLDSFFSKIISVVKTDHNEKYIYAYWSDFDHLGHRYGIGSRQAAEHFAELDKCFAALLKQLSGTDTLVLLTADHGVIDTTEKTRLSVEAHPPLTAMLDIPLCGEPRAAYCYIHDGENAAFEAYVGAELAEQASAVASQRLVDSGLFGPGQPHARLSQRIGDYTLLMRDNFIIQDTLPGEKRDTLIGVHGGLTDSELMVPLIVAEP